MTQQASPAESPDIRAELLGQLFAAQSQLETQLSELRHAGADASLIAECGAQLGALAALQKNVTLASPGALLALRADIAATVAASTTVGQQARAAATTGAATESAQLAAASAATRREVSALHADLFERRIFDPHLEFASPDDEEAYRRREAEGRRYMEEQLAAKTPEGDLNAAGAALDRMLDAHEHGAGDSPEFLPRWNRLIETTQKQREALRSEGRSTDEFDSKVEASVRRFLVAKGLSADEIDARLAQANDPLLAVAPYIGSDAEARSLDVALSRTTMSDAQPAATVVIIEEAAPARQARADAPDLDEVLGILREANVSPAIAATPCEPPTHGVARNADPARASGCGPGH